jgi:hypothetical protein
MLIADPLRIRSGTTPGQGSDGIPDTIPFKLLGIALTMIGIGIIAPQCMSPSRGVILGARIDMQSCLFEKSARKLQQPKSAQRAL